MLVLCFLFSFTVFFFLYRVYAIKIYAATQSARYMVGEIGPTIDYGKGEPDGGFQFLKRDFFSCE